MHRYPESFHPIIPPDEVTLGPNLGYCCDPLLKEKVIAFSFFKFEFDFPLEVIVQNVKCWL